MILDSLAGDSINNVSDFVFDLFVTIEKFIEFLIINRKFSDDKNRISKLQLWLLGTLDGWEERWSVPAVESSHLLENFTQSCCWRLSSAQSGSWRSSLQSSEDRVEPLGQGVLQCSPRGQGEVIPVSGDLRWNGEVVGRTVEPTMNFWLNVSCVSFYLYLLLNIR